jgi:2'-hydroxyisoflavone reductase
VLVPGRRDDPVQIIDVRDLAEFMVRLHEEAKSGVYNVAGPAETLTMPVFINAARDALNANVQLTHVDDYVFLREHKITYSVPWVMLEGKNEGHTSVRYERAKAAGLTYRPLATTVRDTLSWWQTVPEERRSKPRFAITAEQETAALAAWKARKRS